MKPYCVCGNRIVPLKRAGLALNDLGILRSFAVFDFLRTYNGKPFLFEEHWKRFVNSARLVGLTIPVRKEWVKLQIPLLMKRNKVRDASFRFVLTAGPTRDGMTATKPVFYILCENVHTLPASSFNNGAALITADFLRTFPEGKTTNYLLAMTLQKKKRRARAVDILYTKDGMVFEASTSNIFLVSGGKLITPKHSVLPGVTRGFVLTLADKLNLSVVERPIKTKELFSAREIFLTATNKEVLPIVSIDGRSVGGGVPGPITKKLLEAYRAYTRSF